MVLVIFYLCMTAILVRVAPMFGVMGWSVFGLWVLAMARLLRMHSNDLPPQAWLVISLGVALFAAWPVICRLSRR